MLKVGNGFPAIFLILANFRKKERTVRKYNMFAYKKLTFEYYPSIREGKFLGKLVSTDSKDSFV